ncbi:MAG: hypothetical protein NVS9B15_11260 [Acidobacteriaceae bacterium]
MTMPSDRLRQTLNLVLSLGQIVTTVLCFYLGTSFDQATSSKFDESPITPAGYAFTNWSLIYAMSLAYGVWQAFPSRAADPLLRRIGWSTAVAFLGTNVWLVFARLNLTWATFATIVLMLFFLYRAWAVLWPMPFGGNAERWLVRFHLAVFSGWITVATFANFASAMKNSGWADLWIPETAWCVLLLSIAGIAAAIVVRRSRADVPFTLTILWALIAILSNNAARFHNRAMMTTAAAITVLVAIAFCATVFRPATKPVGAPVPS